MVVKVLVLGVNIAVLLAVAAAYGLNTVSTGSLDQSQRAQSVVDISAGESNFPEDQCKLIKIRDSRAYPLMRDHAWNVYRLITADSGYFTEDNVPVPVWATWWTTEEAVGVPDPTFVRRAIGSQESVRAKRRIHHVLRSTRFNTPAKESINRLGLNSTDAVQAAINYFDLVKEFGRERNIGDFDRDSVMIKAGWFHVKGCKNGCQADSPVYTDVPVWRGIERTESNTNLRYPLETWRDKVRIYGCDNCGVKSGEAIPEDTEVAHLDEFYSLRIIDAEMLAEVIQALGEEETSKRAHASMTALMGSDIEVDDFVVLVALHVATKELPDWTWATYWWDRNIADVSHARPKEVSDRDIWKNYAMDTTFVFSEKSYTEDPLEVCFNPWFEGLQNKGAFSNCMNCHQRAVSMLGGQNNVKFLTSKDISEDRYCSSIPRAVRSDYVWAPDQLEPTKEEAEEAKKNQNDECP